MMGHKQGVQALCVPCSSHTLNLVLADAAKSSVASISVFAVLQRLYNLFSSSVQHWAVLQQHVKQLNLYQEPDGKPGLTVTIYQTSYRHCLHSKQCQFRNTVNINKLKKRAP
uniref:DUF4371 domain-containing protein n=1 Tax=Iconisemion striatum TaxID=60296 RepID=A0A1A7WG49_9TELE